MASHSPGDSVLDYELRKRGYIRWGGVAGGRVQTHLLGQSLDELAEKISTYRSAVPADRKGAGHATLMVHAYLGPKV